ncbi:uncharacterized protein JCM6883_004514 [Sporobolomyces salmoneus]|uniref:uncharacterized protein n=1 Tax=Sporobolomyces salmoneus TaxID=183962 RepID=UPI0031728480
MFRKGLENKVILVREGDKVVHHPVFDEVDLHQSDFDKFYVSLGSVNWWTGRGCKVSNDTPALEEYATSPPCRRITFKGYHHEVVIESPDGITVEELMEQVFESWELEPDDEFCDNFIGNLLDEITQDGEIKQKLRRGEDLAGIAEEDESGRVGLFMLLETGYPLTWMWALPPWTWFERLRRSQTIKDDHVRVESQWFHSEE